MKQLKLFAFLLIGLLILTAPNLQAQEQNSLGVAELELEQIIRTSNELLEQEQYEQAVLTAIDAVQKAEAQFGEATSTTLTAVYNLAQIYSALQDYEQAIPTYKKALEIAKTVLGEEQMDSLLIMGELGMLYADVGDYASSLELLEKSFEGKKKLLGPQNPDLIYDVNSLAQIYLAQGMTDKAETLLVFGLENFDGIEELAQDILFTKELLANVYTAQGNYPKAELVLSDVWEAKKKNFGEKELETLITQGTLAETYRLLGQYKKSETLFIGAVEALRETQGDNSPDLYQVISNLAALYEDTGSYEKAEELYLKVYEFDKATLGEGHPNTIVDLDRVAGIYRRMGDYGKAEQTYRKALEMIKKTLGENHPQTVTIMNNLALLNENQGLYDEAEPIFKMALSTSKTIMGEQHPTTLALMNNLAMLYESQGNFRKSEPLYNQTIEFNKAVLGKNHPSTVSSVNNLAYLFLMEEEYEKAAPMFEEVFQVWEKQLGDKNQKTLKAMNNLARVYHKLGKHEKSEELFKNALALRKEVMGEKHPDVVRSQVDLAGLYITLKKYDSAEKLLLDAIKLSEEVLGDKHQYTFDAINNLADLYELSGKKEQSLLYRQKGFDRRSDFFDRVLWAAGENTRQSYIELHKHEQDNYLRMLVADNSPESAKAALKVSLMRKGLLLKIASEIQKVIEVADSPELSEIAKQLTDKRKELASLTLSGPIDETPLEFNKKVVDLEDDVNELQAQLGQKSLAFRTASQFVSVDELFENMTDKDVLVDYLTYVDKTPKVIAVVAKKVQEDCFIFMTCSKNKVNIVPLGELEEARKAVAYMREIIQDETAEYEDLVDAASFSYSKVWKPLNPYIGKRNSIYLVPDSILHILPFDAMMDKDENYLIRSLDLKILSSARDIVIPTLPPASGEFVIVAGPDYDLDSEESKETKKVIQGKRSAVSSGMKVQSHGLRSLSFDPLLGAELEGQTIQEVTVKAEGNSEIYLKKQAQENLLRSVSAPPSMLHIATHGFFLQAEERLKNRLLSLQRGGPQKLPPPADNPLLRAGLAFAGINANAPFLGDIDTNNDGVLTAMEVLSLKLSGTRLVVLSACETGVGEIHEGEGVYGLRRSFQEAGVISVINSLWPVSDEGTRLLMTGLYDRIYKNVPARVALKQSQLELIDSGDWNHPYYWAAFVMVDKPNK